MVLDMQAEAARAAAAAERLTALEAVAAEQQARLEGEAAALARAQLVVEAERDQLKVARHGDTKIQIWLLVNGNCSKGFSTYTGVQDVWQDHINIFQALMMQKGVAAARMPVCLASKGGCHASLALMNGS